MYFITSRFLVRKLFTFYINDMLLFKCPIPGPKDLTMSVLSLATRFGSCETDINKVVTDGLYFPLLVIYDNMMS